MQHCTLEHSSPPKIWVYSRIKKACYLLELRFIGYETDGTSVDNITSPYYWTTVMTGLDFKYNEGANQL